jgi:ribosome biogenesis GTPase
MYRGFTPDPTRDCPSLDPDQRALDQYEFVRNADKLEEVDMTPKLQRLGYSPYFAGHFAAFDEPHRAVARVMTEHRGAYEVLGENVSGLAVLTGKLRHEASSALDLPGVGDWVVVDDRPDSEGRTVVHALLPRKTAFVRRAAGSEDKPQVVAANIDYAFLVSSLNRDFNPRRLERYLAITRESGAEPVILLTKSDLGDSATALAWAAENAPNVAIHVSSSITGEGIDTIRGYLRQGITGVLLGSSGVGKSTLINRLMGEERLATSAIQEGTDKGRHTTTRRELIVLPQGGVLIDTPGMREIGVWAAGATGLAETFEDIAELAQNCRFSDCAHESEPGCAVRAAIAGKTLAPERFESFRRLRLEGQHTAGTADSRMRSDEARKGRIGAKALRAHLKNKRG